MTNEKSVAYWLLLILLNLLSYPIYGQLKKPTAFTVNEGLPSNYVYRAIEDNNGYLWVATDAGIARFDGKHFQLYTTEQGLPDNEVLSVHKEKNGKIWVNCFKQKPAYFDEIQNRFINSTEDKELSKIKEGTVGMNFYPLENEGMLFSNEKYSSIFKNNKLETFNNTDYLIKENTEGYNIYQSFIPKQLNSKNNQLTIYNTRNGITQETAKIHSYKFGENFSKGVNEGKLYLYFYDRGKCYIYSNFKSTPLQYTIDSITIPEPYNNFEYTPTGFTLLGNSGKIYLFDKNTLELKISINGNFFPNAIYNDTKGNIWISTVDKGLLLYKHSKIEDVKLPQSFTNQFFLSIAKKNDGAILAGNFYGQILQIKKGEYKIFETLKKGKVARIRKILFSQNKIFSFSEAGVLVNYKTFVKNNKKTDNLFSKTAINYNDSIILSGHTTSISKINTQTNKVTNLKIQGKRITALEKNNKGEIYFGSTDGLYKYDYANEKTISLQNKNIHLTERITAICSTSDSLTWVATAGSGIVILKNDSSYLVINQKNGILSNSIRCIISAKPGHIWIGTTKGISLVKYNFKKQEKKISVQNLTTSDGISHNIINELIYSNDTIYAATSDGITFIPANINIPKINIPVLIQRVKINQRDTLIRNKYKLHSLQRNIQLKFAGVDLSGHVKYLEYNLDNNKNWIILSDNSLALELSTGSHILQVRAIDVNGYTSKKITNIEFHIESPFWKTYWFWILIGIAIQIILLYFNNKSQILKKKRKLAIEVASVQTAALEQQAFTSLMNPHFIFNALNSIQHFINLQDRKTANRYLSDFASLIRKSFEAAQQYFISLEQEIENITIYLRLEQMRFSTRFSYQIDIPDNIEIEKLMIPTMMIQPLLENALLHGIIPSQIQGKIVLQVKLIDKYFEITIQDNGIGLENSIRFKQPELHKSRGMELINKRIIALNQFCDVPIIFEQSPLYESLTNPGNKITLQIPIDLHECWLTKQNNFNN